MSNEGTEELSLYTEGLSTEEIIVLAEKRPELPWKWGIFLNRQETERFAQENGFTVVWDTPVRPGDIYLAKRVTGFKLLTCRELGEACVYAKEPAYPFDFSECVKVEA